MVERLPARVHPARLPRAVAHSAPRLQEGGRAHPALPPRHARARVPPGAERRPPGARLRPGGVRGQRSDGLPRAEGAQQGRRLRSARSGVRRLPGAERLARHEEARGHPHQRQRLRDGRGHAEVLRAHGRRAAQPRHRARLRAVRRGQPLRQLLHLAVRHRRQERGLLRRRGAVGVHVHRRAGCAGVRDLPLGAQHADALQRHGQRVPLGAQRAAAGSASAVRLAARERGAPAAPRGAGEGDPHHGAAWGAVQPLPHQRRHGGAARRHPRPHHPRARRGRHVRPHRARPVRPGRGDRGPQRSRGVGRTRPVAALRLPGRGEVGRGRHPPGGGQRHERVQPSAQGTHLPLRTRGARTRHRGRGGDRHRQARACAGGGPLLPARAGRRDAPGPQEGRGARGSTGGRRRQRPRAPSASEGWPRPRLLPLLS